MRLILLALCMATVGGCKADRVPEDGRQSAVIGEASGDSLVRAALGDDGARLEYRWVVGTDSTEPQEGRAVFDPGMHRWLTLSDTVLLDLSGVERVKVTDGSDGSGVMVYLDRVSAERLRSSTAAHLGAHLAVLLNGQLLTAPAPIIRTPFSDHILVVGGVDSAVARELAERLSDGLRQAGANEDAKHQ